MKIRIGFTAKRRIVSDREALQSEKALLRVGACYRGEMCTAWACGSASNGSASACT
jgi:hypothetical protein